MTSFNSVIYLFIYVFEQFVSLMYFNATFEKKRSNRALLACFVVSFLVQFAVFLIPTKFTVISNTVIFFACNMFVLCICYKVKLLQSIFNVILLEGLMMTTELVVMYFVSAVMKVDLMAYKDNLTVLFIETAGAKTFYFFVVMFMSKLRNRRNKSTSNDFSMMLLIMPLLTTFIIAIFGKILVEIKIDENIYMLFTVITLLLLLANLIVFFVHERVISTLTQNTELQLEKQRTQISDEYYKELEYQYNLSHVLVHDIKRQLTTIKDIADEENTSKIGEYISSVYDSYEINALKKYSSNKLLNIIVSRYAHICYEKEIELYTNIKNIDLSFISDGDLTAIIDNLLENAVESALKSNNKSIDLTIDKKNEQFVLISLSNSCDTEPQISNGLIKSSKGDIGIHGYGLKSVKKAVKKYNGEIDFKYDKERNQFTVTLMFNNN